jgi:hypothetical protein
VVWAKQDAEKKFNMARNASAPTVNRKDAKKDALRLEQMKPSAGISRKVLPQALLCGTCSSHKHMQKADPILCDLF